MSPGSRSPAAATTALPRVTRPSSTHHSRSRAAHRLPHPTGTARDRSPAARLPAHATGTARGGRTAVLAATAPEPSEVRAP